MIVKYKILTDYKPCIKAVLAKGGSFYSMVLQYIVETAKYKPHWSILKENTDLTIKLFTWKYGFIVKLRFLRSRTNSCRKTSIKASSRFEQSVWVTWKYWKTTPGWWLNGCLSPKIHFYNVNEKCINLCSYVWLEIVMLLALVLD